VLRTRQMNLPPWSRGRVALGLTAAAAEGRFELQVCQQCQAVLIGFPHEGSEHMADDRMLREMTSAPRFRKVLVTDGKTEVGQALVKAMVKAGADIVWVGHAEPWKKLPGFDDITAMKEVTLVPLDLTNERSVSELAGEIGGKVDIVVNNAEVHRSFGIGSRRGTDVARAEMDINYFGLLRLAQGFGPALRARSADGVTHAAAWVNVLSVYALSNYPPHGTFSASKAAALSLSQCLRAEMRPAGIRVVNVFPGPIDDEWNQNLPPPKLLPSALANAVVKALKEGIEDVYPGEVAQEWLERWRDNPKVLERELAAGGN
jgi:NAD(P)-dependent dehydrogenase (short-subunit alcohol dehydrogenase family)